MQCLKRYWSILPTKVSAFYNFALVASSCYSLLQRPCTRCNHSVTASQYNTLRQHVTTCKKTFGEQKVGGSNPSGRTNAKEIPLRYLFCVEVFEGEERRGVRIRVYHLSHTRKTAVKDAEGADAVGRRSLTAGLSLRAHQRQTHRQLWRQLSTIFFCPLFFYSFFRSWAGCKSASSYFFKNSTISLHYLKKRRRPHECGL